MTAREKVEAYQETRACLEHDPIYGRIAQPCLWERFDRQAADAAIEAVREFAREYVKTTIPDSRVWEDGV